MERMIYTNRFFHLPSLYVYILAAVLLVTSVFHAAAIVRHALYVVFNLNDQIGRSVTSPEYVQLTSEAEEYIVQTQNQWQRQNDLANLLRSAIMLGLSLAFFTYFWKTTARAANLEMLFSVRNFYFFAVSSISFLIFFYALSSGLGTAVNASIRPPYYYYHDLYSFAPPRTPGDTPPETVVVTLTDLQEHMAKQEKNFEKNRGRSETRQMIDQFTASLVALPIFYWHNKQLSTPKLEGND